MNLGDKKHVLQIIDVNFNRSKEGLRVVEDIFRFILKDDNLRRKLRKLRHSLDYLSQEKILKKAILNRNAKADLGKNTDSLELKRESSLDVLYINLQRAKESLRVLEEFLKLLALKKVSFIKKIRYDLYILEKEVLKKWPPLRNPRQKNN
jgi:thiamine-phosphate pyrophosphorylase